jgi:hypothetical protein
MNIEAGLSFLIKRIVLSGILLLISGMLLIVKSQELRPVVDTETDTILVTTTEHYPGLASLYAAVLPGLGQAYNGKHWKIPIIYGTFFTFGFLINDNNVKYQYFRRNLIAELDSNPETINDTGREADNLRSNRDKARRNRDFNMIMLAVTYFLQIADAHIDAHLAEFNVSQDISVSVDPALLQNEDKFSPGFSLKMNLR